MKFLLIYIIYIGFSYFGHFGPIWKNVYSVISEGKTNVIIVFEGFLKVYYETENIKIKKKSIFQNLRCLGPKNGIFGIWSQKGENTYLVISQQKIMLEMCLRACWKHITKWKIGKPKHFKIFQFWGIWGPKTVFLGIWSQKGWKHIFSHISITNNARIVVEGSLEVYS